MNRGLTHGRWPLVAVAITGLFFAFFIMGCGKETRPSSEKSAASIRMAWVPYSSSLPALVAEDRGLFQQHGIGVSFVRIETSNEAMSALARGDVDAIAGIGLASVLSVEIKTPGTLLMNWYAIEDRDHWVNAILVPTNSPVASLADLKGKSIATFAGLTQVANLKAIFSKALGAGDAISVEQVAPNLQLQALAGGNVAALFTIEPDVSLAEARGIGRVLVANPRCTYILDPFPAGGGVVSKRFATEHSKEMENLTSALDDAIALIRSDESATKSLLSKQLGLDPAVAQKTRLYAWWTSNEVQVENIQHVVKLFADNGIIPSPVDPATFVYTKR